MTRLIISVRSPVECAAALVTRAEVIDVKEPARGSLGAADLSVVQSIVALVANRRPVSVALGELRDFTVEQAAPLPPVDYVKLGLAGCAERADWQRTWVAAAAAMPHDARLVAVAYADAPRAGSPHWSDIIEVARCHRSGVLLVDTFDKTAGDLLHWIDREQLAQLRAATRQAGVQLALAGSLTRPQIRELSALEPDFIAVRSAICPAGRTSHVSRRLIETIWADLATAHG